MHAARPFACLVSPVLLDGNNEEALNQRLLDLADGWLKMRVEVHVQPVTWSREQRTQNGCVVGTAGAG